jgi:hypothetical protein
MFTLGINVPWIQCGHDLGPRPPAWSGSPRTDFVALERDLARLAALGLSVARFWILAGGVNYPVGRDVREIADRRPFLEPYPFFRRPLAWRERRPERLILRGDLPSLDLGFLEDFERLLLACARAKIALLPSLVSFELFYPIHEQVGGVISNGRGSFALGARQDAFFDATLEPLLEISERHRSSIFAWEVMNEPDWAALPTRHRRSFADPVALSAFLADGAQRIARRDFLATIGFNRADPTWLAPDARRALERLAERGRYLHQVHFYAKEGRRSRLPHVDHSAIVPCLVGELPTAQAERWADPELWDTEADPDRYLEARVALVRDRGYCGALLWSERAKDDQSAFGARQISQIERLARSDFRDTRSRS